MKPWSTRGVEGVFRFLSRVWRLYVNEEGNLNENIKDVEPTKDYERLYHQTVKKVGEDIENLRFNTAISQMMIFINESMKLEVKPAMILGNFILLLSPFAPHIAEELWQKLGKTKSLAYESWPVYDKAKCIESTVEIVLQINGKIRSKISVEMNTQDEELEKLAINDSNVRRYIDGKHIIKKVIIPNKLVNIVVGDK